MEASSSPPKLLPRLKATLTVRNYVKVLYKIRYFTIILWLAAGGASAGFFMAFIANCSQEFSPPPGTQAYDASKQMSHYFPSFADATDLALFIQSTAPPGILLSDTSANTTKCVENFLSTVGDAVAKDPRFGSSLESFESYYSLSALGITSLAQRLLDSTKRKSVATLRMNSPFASKASMDQALDLQQFINGIASSTNFQGSCQATVDMVGVPLLINVALEASAADMGKSDGIVLPIALLVMAITVKSLRLMILPMVTVGLSLAVSFAIMCGVTHVMTVSSAAPSLMMSLGICMSIDYCLFVVSRYVQEARKGVTGHELVAKVIAAAGHTIVVSGSTLMLSLIALVFFPLNILQSFGWGCSLTVLIALVVSLTLCPTLLLTFPNFFERGAKNLKYPSWVHPRIVRFLNHGDENVDPEKTRLLGGDGHLPDTDVGPNDTATKQIADADNRLASPTNDWYKTAVAGDLEIDRKPQASLLSITCDERSASTTHMSSQLALGGSEQAAGEASLPFEKSKPQEPNSPKDIDTNQYVSIINSTIFRKLRVTTMWPWNLVFFLLTCGVAGGMGVAIKDFHITDSFALDLPRGYPATIAYQSLVDSFGYSYLYPYQILFQTNEIKGSAQKSELLGASATASAALGLLEPSLFNYSQGALRFFSADLVIPGGLKIDDFSGVLATGGQWTSHEQISACLNAASDNLLIKGEVLRSKSEPTSASANCTMELISLLLGTVTQDRSGLLMMLFIDVDPIGNDGDPFYRRLLTLSEAYQSWASQGVSPDPSSEFYYSQLAAYELLRHNVSATIAASNTVKLWFSGIGPQSMDAVDTVYRLFPIIIAVSAAIVLVVVGLSFRSIAIPIRSILSIALTELFVFGWVSLVYSLDTGILEWTTSPAVTAYHVPWIDPIVAFSVVLGIALDYDVFLLTRVFELRMGSGDGEGLLSTQDAVLVGLCDTAPIITSAGIIMAIAFFGMLISAMTLLNVLGMFLVSAVLFDTFVIRTFLGPSALSLLGEASWWPRRPPIVPSRISDALDRHN